MPRREGLRPIGDSVKKIIERIRKEREERRNKNKPIRTQPKLPGMKKGGGVDMGKVGEAKSQLRVAEDKYKSNPSFEKLSEIRKKGKKYKEEIGMKDGGISRREEGRRRGPKMGIPSLPGKPRPQPKPGQPPRK